MKEIEIGEYVRTDKGKIGKVVEIRLGFNKDLQVYQDIYKLDNGLWTILEYIVKHSKQLIDLIEEGDYVNGHLVEEVRISCFDSSIFVHEYEIELHDEDIKAILTKGQYVDNCYKVGGEDDN